MGITHSSHDHVLAWEKEVTFDHFKVLRAIGKGSFGKVCIVQQKDSDQMYAMKYMSKAGCLKKDALPNVIQEIRILSLLEHPFLVNLWFSFQDEEDMFVVTDLLLGGDLRYHLLNDPTCFTEESVKLYVAEIGLALDYLKTKRIIHRDVKPDNILLDEKGHAHLADFNVAVMVDEKDADTSSMSGTKPYMAPEIFECALGSAPSYSFNVDWWSLGIVAYELLRGKRPFDIHMSSNIDDIRALIREPLLFPTSWSSGFTDLVSQLLTLNPGKRVSSVSALQSVPCLSPLDFTAIEATRVPATFVPPKGQLNCDPTFELEEMIIESRPLHKKKKRLARQRSHLLRGQSMDVDSDCEAIPVEVGGVSAGHTPPQHSSSFESAVPPSIKDENFIAEFPTYNRIYELAQRDKKLLEQRWENELEAAMKACDPISEVTLKRPSGSEPGSRRLSRVVEEDDAAAATKGGMSLEAPGVAGDKGAAFPPPPSPASPQRKAGTSSPKTLTTPPPSATEKHKKRLRFTKQLSLDDIFHRHKKHHSPPGNGTLRHHPD